MLFEQNWQVDVLVKNKLNSGKCEHLSTIYILMDNEKQTAKKGHDIDKNNPTIYVYVIQSLLIIRSRRRQSIETSDCETQL